MSKHLINASEIAANDSSAMGTGDHRNGANLKSQMSKGNFLKLIVFFMVVCLSASLQAQTSNVCPQCNGVSAKSCENCNGTGSATCWICKGTGKITMTQPSPYGGTMNVSVGCTQCGGTKKAPCLKCNGSGMWYCTCVKNGHPGSAGPSTGGGYVPPPATQGYTPPSSGSNDNGSSSQKTCSKCNGDGKCNWSYSFGLSYCRDGWYDCIMCSGKGTRDGKICPECKGGKKVKCSICNGSGKCSLCGGTGKR